MTLHSQIPCNHHNEDKGRSVTPVFSMQRYTAEESRALENWWLAKMPGAGKSRLSRKSGVGFAQYKTRLLEAVQDWAPLSELLEICDMRRGPVTSFVYSLNVRDHMEVKRFDGEYHYRLTDEGRRYGYRFADPSKVIVPFLSKWMTAKELADAIGCSVNYLTPHVRDLCGKGVLVRERRTDNWYYIRAGAEE